MWYVECKNTEYKNTQSIKIVDITSFLACYTIREIVCFESARCNTGRTDRHRLNERIFPPSLKVLARQSTDYGWDTTCRMHKTYKSDRTNKTNMMYGIYPS